jgi:hypothetical protein
MKSIWTRPIELLDDCHIESRFSLFGDIVSFGARLVHDLRLMHLRLRNHFSMHPMILLGKGAQVEAKFGLFGYSANLDARKVHELHGTYHMLRNLFEST